jgi:hypothetical protein
MFDWLKKLLGARDTAPEVAPRASVAPATAGGNPSYVRPQPSEAEALADLEAFIGRLVAAGFETPEEILRAAEDYIADDLDQRRIDVVSGPMLERALAAHAAAEKAWPALTDCDRLDAAFAALERKGVIARQNFSCCGNCGSSEIWDEVDAARDAGDPAHGYAFFHMQDTERAVDDGGLYLNYGAVDEGEEAALSVGHEIVTAVEAAGLKADWDGSWDQRIHVSLDWKRRRANPVAPPSSTLH